jgi:hypothetical protein
MSEDIKKSLGIVAELPALLINEKESDDVVKSIKEGNCTLQGRLNSQPEILPVQKSFVKGEPIEKAHMIVMGIGDMGEMNEDHPDYLKNTHGEDFHPDADKEMIQYFTTTKQIDPSRCPVYNPPTQPDPRGLVTGAVVYTKSEKVESALENLCKGCGVAPAKKAKFERCVGKVKAKGGVNPYAVCHTSVGKSDAGEGSRGGHIIGHTKSGKAIYGEWSVHHTDFTEADHADAAKAYKKKGDKNRARIHEKLSKPETYKEDRVVKAYVGFKKLSQQIGAGGKVSNPKAVAAAIGRKKYGKQAFQAAASAGRSMRPKKAFEDFHNDLVKSYAAFIDAVRSDMEKGNVHFKPYKPPRPGALIHQPKSKEQAKMERAQRRSMGVKSETGVKDVSFGGQSFFVPAAEKGGEISKAEEKKPWPGENVSEFWGKPHGWQQSKKKLSAKKEGEGSRGGVIAGHTKGGNPIYEGHKPPFQSKVDPVTVAGQQVKEQKAQEAKEVFAGKKS